MPFAFIGGAEAIPVIYHATTLAKLLGTPYFPVTPYLLPIPRPVNCHLRFGPPMFFEGSGNESDEVVQGMVDQVSGRISALIDESLATRQNLRTGVSG